MHNIVILIIKGLKTFNQKNSHNATVIKFSAFLFISLFSQRNSTIVKALNNISLFFKFVKIEKEICV